MATVSGLHIALFQPALMAYSDEPTVDENAKKSEESVNAVRSLLTHRNGFIGRVETPDYGVDFNVELVSQSSGATSQMFPVQIKSTAHVAVITRGEERYIALPFKTSRLGYLCRRAPVCGIIVVYDDETGTCYFDYVDAIVTRLDQRHGAADWRSQDQVTVHLPLQELDVAALRVLHEKFSQAYERLHLLLRSQGANYDLPSYVNDVNSPAPFDFHNPRQIAELLEEFGGLLYSRQDFKMLLGLLGRLPPHVVTTSRPILFIAALTYAQVGNVLEADYYLAKCDRQVESWDATGSEALEFARIRVAFIKGEASPADYRQQVANLQAHSQVPLNKLTFASNLLYLDLLESFDDEQTEPSARAIEALFQAIEDAPIEVREKQHLKLFNSENLHTLGCSQLLRDASRNKARDELHIPYSPVLRLARAQAIVELVTRAINVVAEVATYAQAHDDNLLAAGARQAGSRFFLALHYSLMMIHIREEVECSEVLHTQYVQQFNASVAAYNYFREAGLLKDAHQALSTCYELLLLYHLRYRQLLAERTAEEILPGLRELEREAGIAPFESSVRPAYEGMKARVQHPTINKVADIPEGELPAYAKRYLQLVGLPADRLPYLLADLKARWLFGRECQNEDVQLVVDERHRLRRETAYTSCLSYQLHHRSTNFRTPLYQDMRELLADFKELIRKSS